MGAFRYDTQGRWFKGNTHLHSEASDGGMSVEELEEVYAGAGYDFLFLTDHWAASHEAERGDGNRLLWMNGIELDGVDDTGSFFHVVCLGDFQGLAPEMGFPRALESARSQGGFLILAHPQWSENTMEDALRWDFDGVEVYNHVCRWINGKSDGGSHWLHMLGKNRSTLAFASDDAHLNRGDPQFAGWNGGLGGGWIVVNAAKCGRDAIMSAIRSGNFYASNGPEILSLSCEGRAVSVLTSPAQTIRLVGPAWRGERVAAMGGALITEARFEIPEEWPYAYLDVEDATGRRAWTNTLLVEDR